MREQHETVHHRHAEQRNKSHACGNAERHPADKKSHNSARRRNRNVEIDQQGRLDCVECRIEQHEDEEERDRHDQEQPRGRALKVLELAAVFHVIASRELHLRLNRLLDIGDETAEIPASHVGFDRDAPVDVFPRNLSRPSSVAMSASCDKGIILP